MNTRKSLFIQGLVDKTVRTHLFRLELETLDQAISVAEQEALSLYQAQTNSKTYRPVRRQEIGCTEPMDFSFVKGRGTSLIKEQAIAEVQSLPEVGTLRL